MPGQGKKYQKGHGKSAACTSAKKAYTKGTSYDTLLRKQAERLECGPRGIERSGLIGVRQSAILASASGGETFPRNKCRQISAALEKDGLYWYFLNFSRIEVW